MTAAAETDIFKIQRNLSDAGFAPSLIQKFLSLSQQKKAKGTVSAAGSPSGGAARGITSYAI